MLVTSSSGGGPRHGRLRRRRHSVRAAPRPPPRRDLPARIRAKLIVKSELRLKADLIRRNLDRSPQLVFFGGSRSQRFDPVFARQRTGLRAVNISLSCARPEAAWAYLNWFYRRWPDAKIRWVWGMQSGMLRDRDLDPALLQDPRFYRYFPDDLLAQQRAHLPDSKAEMPHSYGFMRNRYSISRHAALEPYDQRLSPGLHAPASRSTPTSRRCSAPAPDRPNRTRARAQYFEKTIRLLNDHGTTPVIVLMPIHPRVLRVMKAHDMGGERQTLREYLAGLSARRSTSRCSTSPPSAASTASRPGSTTACTSRAATRTA